MTDFDVIECGYNLADETINFGTRSLADGDNLYEVSTLATLRSSNEAQLRPRLAAIVKNGSLYFTTNNSFRIFKDKECSDVVFNGTFDAIIDTFCVSFDGAYVLLCLRDGSVHLVVYKTEYEIVTSMSLIRSEDKTHLDGPYFINSFPVNGSFLAITRKGQFYRIVVQDCVKVVAECIHDFCFETEVASYQYPFLFVNGAKLAVLNLNNNHVVSDKSRIFKRVVPTTNLFLALDLEGKLFGVCPLSLLIFPFDNSTVFKDFVLVRDEKCEEHVIAVAESGEQSVLQLLSSPNFALIYSVKVSTDVHLITPESVNDELLYVSQISDEKGNVNELRLHIVYETCAEQRLQRLLRRQKYEEAMKFAELFRLDPTIINKAKAQAIVDKSICDSDDINNLINLMNVIDDDEFKLQCCLDLGMSNLDDVRKILNYGCTLVPKKQNKPMVEDLQKSIAHLVFRFDTFRGLNWNSECQMEAWVQFSGCDLIRQLKEFLNSYQIDKANIIYSRLDEATIERLTEETISDVLDDLRNIPISVYQPFLPTFIPITLSILPSTLPLFVRWTYSKVFHLEKRSEIDFPKNAIKFTENIVGLMKVGDATDISFQRQCTLLRDSLRELSKLLSALKSLKTLKDDFGITIPVTAYLCEPKDVVRNLLNVEMCTDIFDVFLKEFLSKFMLENTLDPNEIFFEEIMNLIKYEEKYWVHIIPSILNCINSISFKLEAVKEILDSAVVPWCQTVVKIANDALNYYHPLVAQIKELIEDEPLQIVLRKPKYKIKEKRIDDLSTLEFVVRRIIYCNDQSMVQDVYQLCVNPEQKHVANILLIKHFIRSRNFEEALELFENNAPEEVLNCARELAVMAELIIDNESGLPEELRDSYHEAVGAIFERLNCQSDDFQRTCNEETLNLVKNTYSLFKNFQIKTSSHNLRSLSHKNTILNDFLGQVNRELETGKRTVGEAISICHKISAHLSVESDQVLIKFCELSADYKVIFKTAQRVYSRESSSRNLCMMAILLLKYAGIHKLRSLEDSYSESESLVVTEVDCDADNEVFCNGLQLADKIMSKAIFRAAEDGISDCMKIANWVNTTFYCTERQDGGLKKVLFGDRYSLATVAPGFLTFGALRMAFNIYSTFVQLSDFTLVKCANLTEDELLREIKQLPSVVENLCKDGQHYTAFKLISTLQDALICIPKPNEDILTCLSEILRKRCLPKLIPVVLSNNTIDGDLLYSLLLCCECNDALLLIKNGLRLYKRHPKKLGSILKVGLRFWKYHNLTTGTADMMKALITLKWWKKIDNKKLDYDNFFKVQTIPRLEILIHSGCMDTSSVEEFCKDYNATSSVGFEYFFRQTLLNWRPEYEIKVDTYKKRYMVLKNNEDNLMKVCQEIMKHLSTEEISRNICDVWSSIKRYYYEVFIVMFNILATIDPEQDNSMKISMLLFLKNYHRVSKPSEVEAEQWYTTFPETQALDALSEFRLPYTPHLFTKQIWSIIRPEINLKTYKLWFDAIEIVSPYLNENDICSYVVSDVVASGILTHDATEQWVLHSKHEDLFLEIEECVKHIYDLERMSSVTYHLLIHTPNGADQVKAARLCYKCTLEYKNQNPKVIDVEKAFIKVERKYFNSSAMHILHTHQLAENKYVDLVAHPNDLILALYLDERILKRGQSVDLHCPDINKATEALATLFSLDIKKIRIALLETWLLDCSTSTFDFDSSVIYTQAGSSSENDNLKRAAYMCCSEESFWQLHLIRLAHDSKNKEQNVSFTARALKVFAMISDVETITSQMDSTYDEFVSYIDKLTLLSDLEYLGIGLDVDGLDRHNKKELLNRLVKRAGTPVSIKTMAAICMTYHLYDSNYWEFIINTCIKLSMHVELKTYVNFLKKPTFQHKSFYINAWQKLIDYSFTSINFQEHQVNEIFIDNFRMIQSCPVLYCLNFDRVFSKCMESGKVEFAVVLLQYVEGERRDKFVKEIRKSDKDFGQSLSKLVENGLWGIRHVQEMLAACHE